ncbi:DUF2061 domain-containing protein [Vibrio sp.]|nr:DUF2061 domain-containing protein [Vibrio sp.]
MKKTLLFAIVHFSIATSLVYLFTGDFLLGSAIALIEPSINTVAFYYHEKVWQKVTYLRKQSALHKTISFGVIHFSVAFGVITVLTGNYFAAGVIAVLEPLANTVAFYFIEKRSNRIETGYKKATEEKTMPLVHPVTL